MWGENSYVYIYTYMYLCMYIYMNMYMNSHMCTYIYTCIPNVNGYVYRIDNKYKCGEETGSNGHVSNINNKEIECHNMTKMIPKY
jgi:hypothetical protein